MKIELPLEKVWMEVFGFLPRSELAELVLHIRDRQFASFLQSYLHEFGEITLGKFSIKSPKKKGGPAMLETARGLDMPLLNVPMPMPENINNFGIIHLSYIDESILGFLQEFERNSLLGNANLLFCNAHSSPDVQLGMLNKVLPLISSIYSIKLNCHKVLALLQKEYAGHEQFKRMLTSARALYTCYNFRVEWFCRWLHQPREDGRARLLFGNMPEYDGSIAALIERVKKDFLLAKQAVSFFGRIYWLKGVGNVQKFTLFNFQTHELLMVQESHDQLKFGRYPNGPKKELMAKEMAKDAICLEYRNIAIDIEEIKIDLQMDIWANVFGFLSRPQLAELAAQIGSWHFASRIQVFLHDLGEFTLEKLHIKSATNGPGPAIFKTNQEMPLTNALMSNNIKNFKEIHLSYQDLDISLLSFLTEFERNALFTNVNLVLKSEYIHYSDMAHLSYILPMMTSIESVSIHAVNGTDLLKFFYSDLITEWTMPMLTSTQRLYACYSAHDDSFIRWLHNPRGDGKPRVLVIHIDHNSLIEPFIGHVKKDFLGDKEAVSFFVHILSLHIDNIPPVTTVTVSNIQTYEKLVFTRMQHRCMRIARCPMEATEEWIEEISKYTRSEYRNIIIDI